jgi:hypothetical protein
LFNLLKNENGLCVEKYGRNWGGLANTDIGVPGLAHDCEAPVCLRSSLAYPDVLRPRFARLIENNNNGETIAETRMENRKRRFGRVACHVGCRERGDRRLCQ